MVIEYIILPLIIIFILIKLNKKPAGLPPGEWGLPIIGYLPSKGEEIKDLPSIFRKKFGNTYFIKFGSRILIMLCDYSTIKSAFAKPEITMRPDFYSFQIFYNFLNDGIIFSNAALWSTNRRFALRCLRDFGLGKTWLEDVINIQVKNFIDDLKNKIGKPTFIDYSLNSAIINVLWDFIASRKFDLNDKEVNDLSKMVNENTANIDGPIIILDFYPYLSPLVPYLPKFVLKWLRIDHMNKNISFLRNYCAKIISEHVETLDKENPRDYVDMYLIEMEKEKNSNTNLDREYHNLASAMLDLFAAGSDTTSTTIRWWFLYMAKYQSIQKKIQQEIDSVVPKDRFPSLHDREKLPYLEAAIHEMNRCVTLVPLSLPHLVTEDTIIDGYRIPKGAVVNACIEECHHQPDYWEKPDEFYPEHFINAEGKFYIRKEGYIPFSIGRRQCLGESLAKMELFLFIGAILQQYTICEPEGESYTMKPNPNSKFLNQPQSFKVLLKNRL